MSRKNDSDLTPSVLADCPDIPNCVSSQASNPSQRVEPFACGGSCSETLSQLEAILLSMSDASIVVATESYVRVEFTTTLFRFVDDLELLADPETKVLHVRSASRVGTWDLGLNRRRVETLRRRLAKTGR